MNLRKELVILKKSVFAEYPFGQNNFGLINEIYLNKKENVEYVNQKSSRHNFPLAEFNLGQMLESENKKEDSIKYFVLASEHEEEPLIYREITRDNKRLRHFLNIKTISFSDDLQINTFEFYLMCPSLEEVTIPGDVTKFNENWCKENPKLTKVTISP